MEKKRTTLYYTPEKMGALQLILARFRAETGVNLTITQVFEALLEQLCDLPQDELVAYLAEAGGSSKSDASMAVRSLVHIPS